MVRRWWWASARWSGTGNLVAIISEDPFYIRRFDREAFNGALASGVEIGDEGVIAAFEVVAEVSDRCVSVCSSKWLGDIHPTVSRPPGGQVTASSIPAYTSSVNRLNHLVGTQTHTITHLDT